MSLIKLLAKLPIDLGQGSVQRTTKAKLIAFAGIPKASAGQTALDIGCGDGYWSEKMKALGYRVTSIDMERTYPNEDSEKRYESMQPVDVNKPLPFADASFDVIWCSEVIEHLPNYKATINEIRRVLKPGGMYAITTPNSFFWLHYLLRAVGLKNKDWQNSGHVNFFSLRDIKQLFPEADVYGYFPYTLVKFAITRCIGLLSPSFAIVGRKVSGRS